VGTNAEIYSVTKKATDRGPTHEGFLPAAWVKALDLTTLEKCSGSYVSDDLRDRADDLIWRVR